MSRPEIYPWITLQKVGDYFIVTEEFKPNCHYFMNATVAQRNVQHKGRAKYTCVKTTYGCIVMLVQLRDDLPPHDYEVVPGLFASANRFDADAAQPLGNRPQARELTLQERVDRLPQQVKYANLPWWYEKGSIVWNTNSKHRDEDREAWINNRFNFGPNDPYPEFYRLDENLMRVGDLPEDTVTEDEDEDFGGEPIYVEGKDVDD